MRAAAAVALALALFACRAERPARDAAPAPALADADLPRFLVVTVRRIEVIDRYPLEEIRFGPITTMPPVGALRGLAETAWDQQQRDVRWMDPENIRRVP
jgi:hypothetical protein